MALGRDEDAVRDWSLALDDDPEDPGAYLGRARPDSARTPPSCPGRPRTGRRLGRGSPTLLPRITAVYALCLVHDRIDSLAGAPRSTDLVGVDRSGPTHARRTVDRAGAPECEITAAGHRGRRAVGWRCGSPWPSFLRTRSAVGIQPVNQEIKPGDRLGEHGVHGEDRRHSQAGEHVCRQSIPGANLGELEIERRRTPRSSGPAVPPPAPAARTEYPRLRYHNGRDLAAPMLGFPADAPSPRRPGAGTRRDR